jgi:hypothetical protein
VIAVQETGQIARKRGSSMQRWLQQPAWVLRSPTCVFVLRIFVAHTMPAVPLAGCKTSSSAKGFRPHMVGFKHATGA